MRIRKLRVEFVCRRLTTSNASLVEIALAAAFSDQSHFSNTFKRHLLARRVRDAVLLRLIGKWLNAGVLEGGTLS
jgi:AraC-like DNA-binding protein